MLGYGHVLMNVHKLVIHSYKLLKRLKFILSIFFRVVAFVKTLNGTFKEGYIKNDMVGTLCSIFGILQ
jgi:hypothetical protein